MMKPTRKLYSYYRSSAAFRVRIALALKALPVQIVPVHLLKNGGEQRSRAYLNKNPQGLVPALEIDSHVLTQSLAIIEWLEEAYPDPSLYPQDAMARAEVRSFVLNIACDIHPLNNLRVTQYLDVEMGVDERKRQQWYVHWITQGFGPIEQQLARGSGTYCFGDKASVADVFLVPQVYNAKRFAVSLEAFPHISRVYEHCLSQEPFFQAAPERQPDAEEY